MNKKTVITLTLGLVLFSAGYFSPVFADAVPSFTKDLRTNDTDPQVKALQQFLNAQGFTIAKSGAGSPGNESAYFGAKTKIALNAFQRAKGLSLGYFGPLTRAYILAHYSGGFGTGTATGGTGTSTGTTTGTGAGSTGTKTPCATGDLFNFLTGLRCGSVSTGTGGGGGASGGGSTTTPPANSGGGSSGGSTNTGGSSGGSTNTGGGGGGGTTTPPVTTPPVVTSPACAITSFTATPSTITAGANTTLSWTSANCSSLNITGTTTNLPLTGSQTLNPSATATYSITAVPNGGISAVTVTVNPAQTQTGTGTGTGTTTPPVVTPPTNNGTSGTQLTNTPIGYAMVSGTTTGGQGGTTVTVSNLADLKAAVSGSTPKIIYVTGTITGSNSDPVYVGSNKSIIGRTGATMDGVNLFLFSVNNVIVQNLTMKNYVSDAGVQVKFASTHVWIDHCDFSTDRNHGWDYYGKDISVTRGSDFVTISWNKFHDNNLSVLIGGGIGAGHEDELGKLHVTMHHNYWYSDSEREPAVVYGRVHMFNDYHLNNGGYSIGSRADAIVRTDNEYFSNAAKPISTNLAGDPPGYISGAETNYYTNSGANDITTAASTWVPTEYSYSSLIDPVSTVIANVTQGAGPRTN